MSVKIKRRGYLESAVDDQLSEENLKTYFDLFNEFSPKIGSLEDAVFGFIIGNTFANYCRVCEDIRNGSMTKEDILLFVEIIKRRTLEIKSKIREIGHL